MSRLAAVAWVLLMSAGLVADEKPAKSVAGYWLGTLKVGAIELRLGFNIEKKPDGTLAATVDSIDQGAAGIKADAATFADNTLTLKMPDSKYSGTLQPDGDSIRGTLEQGAIRLPLELKRLPGPLTLNRPQTPKKPYPYVAEDVTFPSRAKGVTLAGTYTRPKGTGPFPAVALISGSGPQDRDESLMGHKPFQVLADHLTRAGVAVLRYDDRGVGESKGSFATATTRDFSDDAAGAVSFLKARKEVAKVGLIGHSEGALIAPMLAAESADVGFIVLLAGPGVSGEEILYSQGQAIVKAMGGDDKVLARQKAIQTKFFALVKEGADDAKIKAAVKDLEKDLTPAERKASEGQLASQLATLTTPWFKFFLTLDPRTSLERVKCPVLAITGEKDLQVPPAENLEAIAAALKKAGNPDVTTKTMPGLNHLFQTCKTGLITEYGKLEETFAPAALETIAEWVKKRGGK